MCSQRWKANWYHYWLFILEYTSYLTLSQWCQAIWHISFLPTVISFPRQVKLLWKQPERFPFPSRDLSVRWRLVFHMNLFCFIAIISIYNYLYLFVFYCLFPSQNVNSMREEVYLSCSLSLIMPSLLQIFKKYTLSEYWSSEDGLGSAV